MPSFLKSKQPRPAGPRKNQWRGSRAGQITSQQAEARRARTVARRARLIRWGGLMAGAVMVGWVLTTGVKHSGPALKRLLEIKAVTVEGAHRIDKQEVIDLVGLKPGTPLHHIVTTAIKSQVESHPWVKEALVTRVPLHELRISVIERKPAAIVRTGSENFLIDEEGHVLARLGQADDDTLPMVTGVDSKGLLRGDGSVRQAVMSGIELAKLVGHTYEGRLQVNAANPSNLVASVRGVQFQFGGEAVGDQWDRFQRVKPTLKTLNFDGHGRGANEVDLRYENRIIVRERG
ncbi:MAG TPA: FtsQ-type POTRA domain-containing protein [Nitrospiraceae bacterium]|nr:FtsQ-type POTRA domain-containing protein [Nitrospiraceae bacterium]